MTAIPEDWSRFPLRKVVQPRYGKALHAAEREAAGKYPVVASGGVIGHATTALSLGPTVVVGRKGAAGSVQYFEAGCWPTDTTYWLAPPTTFDARFLAFQLESKKLRQYDHSTALPSLLRPDLEAVDIAFPLLPEQRAIVDMIDALLSRLSAGQKGLTTIASQTAALRMSILHAAVNGRLVAGPAYGESGADFLHRHDVQARGSGGLPTGWCWCRLGDIARVGSGATPRRSTREYWGGDIPWVTSGQLTHPYVDAPSEYITSKALAETAVKIWPKGTLLVAMYGEGRTRGHCSELRIDATTNQACAALVLHEPFLVVKEFVKINLEATYEANRRAAAGGVQPNLSLGYFANLLVPFPPLDVQMAILDEADRLKSICDAVLAAIRSTADKAGHLRDAILGAAFRGELILQSSTISGPTTRRSGPTDSDLESESVA
jgi:type I restriction enzyme S subunit